ncbi:MAG: hypothetical protein B0W54_13745 [Cellvibrio sp. 79]|nr:MAG: hypothetical protein B0W54_13745 [Cellvibrio sp. 79]
MNLIVIGAALWSYTGRQVRLMMDQQATIAPLFRMNPAFWRVPRPLKAAALYYQRANNTLF